MPKAITLFAGTFNSADTFEKVSPLMEPLLQDWFISQQDLQMAGYQIFSRQPTQLLLFFALL
jgi:hypothetical protein